MQDWALAHPTLAAKVKPGQAGYAAIRDALAELPAGGRPAPPPPVPAAGPTDAQYASWALANEPLARRVTPDQAGYAVIQAVLAELDRARGLAEPAPPPPVPEPESGE